MMLEIFSKHLIEEKPIYFYYGKTLLAQAEYSKTKDAYYVEYRRDSEFLGHEHFVVTEYLIAIPTLYNELFKIYIDYGELLNVEHTEKVLKIKL